MSHKRVIRIISYEGISEWVNYTLDRSALSKKHTMFNSKGTIRELARVELIGDETMEDALLRYFGCMGDNK